MNEDERVADDGIRVGKGVRGFPGHHVPWRREERLAQGREPALRG